MPELHFNLGYGYLKFMTPLLKKMRSIMKRMNLEVPCYATKSNSLKELLVQ